MQITLNQEEIEAAVKDYVHAQINVAEGQDISIDFTNGRGDKGLTASLDIVPARVADEPKAAKTPTPKPKKTSPVLVKEEPVEQAEEEEQEEAQAISSGEERTDPEEEAAPEETAETVEEKPKKSIFARG
jgi:hypothetical protein